MEIWENHEILLSGVMARGCKILTKLEVFKWDNYDGIFSCQV